MGDCSEFPGIVNSQRVAPVAKFRLKMDSDASAVYSLVRIPIAIISARGLT